MNQEIICKEVIVSTILRRGKGIENDPVRCVLQVYEKDGTLIAENDEYKNEAAIVENKALKESILIAQNTLKRIEEIEEGAFKQKGFNFFRFKEDIRAALTALNSQPH